MGMGGQSDREDDLAILPILPEAVAENIAKTFEEFTGEGGFSPREVDT